MAHEVVYSVASPSGQYRAEVIRLSPGAFRVEVFRWTEEWVEGYGKLGEFWEPVRCGNTYSDTVERAAVLACEKLAVWEPPTPDTV